MKYTNILYWILIIRNDTETVYTKQKICPHVCENSHIKRLFYSYKIYSCRASVIFYCIILNVELDTCTSKSFINRSIKYKFTLPMPTIIFLSSSSSFYVCFQSAQWPTNDTAIDFTFFFFYTTIHEMCLIEHWTIE